MSRWFRWYEGTSEDAKFRVVARLSRVTVRDVIALWAFILEDAAHLAHRGVCKRNENFMTATLDFEDGVVERILSAMQDTDMISVGHGAITVCNFNKRQFESDTDPTAAERQRNKRERDKQASNEPVTRDSRRPDTEEQIQSQTQKQKEVGAPEGEKGTVVDFPSPYAFEGEVIRLRQDQFDRWRNIFPKLHDLTAELALADAYYVENPPKGGKWFFPVSKWLENANREQAFKPKRKGVYGDDWW